MSPAQAQQLRQIRLDLAEFQESIDALERGDFRLLSGDRDISQDHIAQLKAIIASNQAMLASYDPQGMTALEPGDRNR